MPYLINEDFTGFRIDGGAWLFEGPSTAERPEVFPPVSIIQRDQSWGVRFRWLQEGTLTDWLHPECHYLLTIYMEKMGGGEYSLPGATKKVDHVNIDGHLYDENIVIGPNVVPVGLYKIVVSLRYHDQNHNPKALAAFAEMGMVDFYQEA